MEIKELLTTYWSQVTLVLLGIGYFIKRILDVNLKKKETNHNLFQQNRINTVNKFFENYAEVELMWTHIEVYSILERNYSSKEIDKIIFPSLNKLSKNILELKVYFSDDDLHYFENLVNGMISINSYLSKLYFSYNEQENTLSKANKFSYFRDQVFSANKNIMNELCSRIRRTFNEN